MFYTRNAIKCRHCCITAERYLSQPESPYFCKAVLRGTAFFGEFFSWTRNQLCEETDKEGEGLQKTINEGSLYSVAVLPADRNRDDVRNADCNEISEAEIQGEAGLRDYLPTKLPDGFHFDQASLYVTTMNDGTIFKRLLITYRTGKGAKALPKEEGAEVIPNAHDLGEEFRINVFSFMPDTSAEIYSVEEVRSELQSGNLGNGYFCVQYGDYYVGIEPLSLSAEEILGLIESIGR